jgi:uncharacterized protein
MAAFRVRGKLQCIDPKRGVVGHRSMVTGIVQTMGEMTTMTRRLALKQTFAGSAALLSTARNGASQAVATRTSQRPSPSARKFQSKAVEAELTAVKARIADPELAWLFENCYPNTLDTTVQFNYVDKRPDTFVITGDIDAMWLRDSSAQVWPYLPLASKDERLRLMLEGLIRRQARCILLDPYANAFLPGPDSAPLSWSVQDVTDHKPGVGERKWEIDSLCYPIRLAHGYWINTHDKAPFDAQWQAAMKLVVATFREQQRLHDHGPYHFQRKSEIPTETQFLGGYGNPTKPVGLIHSMFRPSDDACLYPLFIPANLFAVVSLRQLAVVATEALQDSSLANAANSLAQEVEAALNQYGRMQTTDGEIWAYEVDGYGNQLFMDDANAPGLLSLPYLGSMRPDDPLYLRTRKLAWSTRNPYFFQGKVAEGIGGPHEGLRMIWPMSITMRALTSLDDQEIRQCLRWLKASHAGSGFMHESFDQDDAAHFTRAWFAWANTLFGELMIKLSRERPALLQLPVV